MSRQIRYESAQRYYLVRCARNLFGDLVLSRYWGGLGSRRGGERHAVMADADALADIARNRLSDELRRLVAVRSTYAHDVRVAQKRDQGGLHVRAHSTGAAQDEQPVAGRDVDLTHSIAGNGRGRAQVDSVGLRLELECRRTAIASGGHLAGEKGYQVPAVDGEQVAVG